MGQEKKKKKLVRVCFARGTIFRLDVRIERDVTFRPMHQRFVFFFFFFSSSSPLPPSTQQSRR